MNSEFMVFGELSSVCEGLNRDELSVVLWLAKRIKRGRDQYGPLDIASDKRDWQTERAEEIADLLIYSAFSELKRGVAP